MKEVEKKGWSAVEQAGQPAKSVTYKVDLQMEGQDPKSWTIQTEKFSMKARAIAYIEASRRWKFLYGASKQAELDLAGAMLLPKNPDAEGAVRDMKVSCAFLDEVLEVLRSAP